MPAGLGESRWHSAEWMDNKVKWWYGPVAEAVEHLGKPIPDVRAPTWLMC
jgi:hypothetical protein